MALLDEKHRNLISLFELYAAKRTNATERFGARMVGNTGSTELTLEEVNWLEPRAFEMNSIIDGMLNDSEQYAKSSWDALMALHEILEREFKLKHKLERVAVG